MKKILHLLGPGLLFAGTSIGVSHLVQATRAGAMFNFDLIWILVLAFILKYPFFEFGPRYANATGFSLVKGYQKVGNWAVFIFAFLTLISMFILQAAVTVVTVGILAHILNITIDLTFLSFVLLVISGIILLWGKYSLLDKLIKYIIVIMAVSTLVAVFAALGIHKEVSPDSLLNFEWSKSADIFFLIAFVGWMPSPIDVSVWSSMWNLEKIKKLGYVPELKAVLTEFRIGYIFTALLAIAFVLLGALIMYGTGEEFSSNGTIFSGQLIKMYTTSIGSWSYWIISIAAFTTMFSTTITVLDAYSRVLSPVYQYMFRNHWEKVKNNKSLIFIWLIILILGSSLIIAFAAKTMVLMVTIATTLSFLTAPILAWLNYRVVTDEHMPEDARPGKGLKILSWIGIIFLTVFSFIYLYWAFLK
ncbi:MAG: divalent metal cation transporter [Bacteroidales bacterium]|nr:divalent metal cation transporter [Bacteroidales bacterium]MCF8405485.1 divalent metal cation transporter [Bacteroidales bacterium]